MIAIVANLTQMVGALGLPVAASALGALHCYWLVLRLDRAPTTWAPPRTWVPLTRIEALQTPGLRLAS